VNRGKKKGRGVAASALLTLVPFGSEGLVAATGQAADLRRSSAGWTRRMHPLVEKHPPKNRGRLPPSRSRGRPEWPCRRSLPRRSRGPFSASPTPTQDRAARVPASGSSRLCRLRTSETGCFSHSLCPPSIRRGSRAAGLAP
jgi:hypothetical protein